MDIKKRFSEEQIIGFLREAEAGVAMKDMKLKRIDLAELATRVVTREAKDKGVLFAVNPDAHAVDELDHVSYGVGAARKGWLEAGDIINTLGAADIRAVLGRKRAKGS